jgi:hypothetical protein
MISGVFFVLSKQIRRQGKKSRRLVVLSSRNVFDKKWMGYWLRVKRNSRDTELVECGLQYNR